MKRKPTYPYMIWIHDEGEWPIPGKHPNKKSARLRYLKWAKLKRVPNGSFIERGYE